MSKRVRLVFGAFAAAALVSLGAAPALAQQGRADCGIGSRVGFFSSTASKSGNGQLNGAFAKDSAQNSDPNFGLEISGPTGATNCA